MGNKNGGLDSRSDTAKSKSAKSLSAVQSKYIKAAITNSVVPESFTKEVDAYIKKLRANLEDIL